MHNLEEIIEMVEDWLDADSHANLLPAKIMLKDMQTIAELLAPRILFLFSTLQQKIEDKYGKYGTQSGSLGYQGMIMGIRSYQTEADQMRDDILGLLTNRK